MRYKSNKRYKWIKPVIFVAILVFLFVQAVRTGCAHFKSRIYDKPSWELVWPVIVSTLIAVFGTLVTSYVFLKDALDRTIDEKPYYEKIIGKYRRERVRLLRDYSIIFVAISCYLILFQGAGGDYDGFLYFGIICVAVLLLCSLYFLVQCINIDEAIYKAAQRQLAELDMDMREKWKKLENKWRGYINSYIHGWDESLQEFLEVEPRQEKEKFDKSKFIVRFSEWERFIFLFLDKTFEFQRGQSVEQRIVIAAGYIEKQDVVQKVEKGDAEGKGWGPYGYESIQNHTKKIDRDISIEDFLTLYQLLSDYRDTLRVTMDKESFMHGRHGRKLRKEEQGTEIYVLYLFFLMKFFVSLKCLVTIPKVEIFYPSAKMHNVDFYNVRFENTSFRVALFRESMLARMKMTGSNIAFSKFEDCNFYNADLRDCSMSNTHFRHCLMSDMILFNVDATGAAFYESDFSGATFENSIVTNIEFHDSRFEYTSFIDCKLEEVKFEDVVDKKFVHANFEKSILKKVHFCNAIEGEIEIPDRYKACNKNYFRDLPIENRRGEIKKRRDPDIWRGIQSRKRFGMDLTASSFLEAVAEEMSFQNACLDASIFNDSDMQRSVWKNTSMRGCVMRGVNLTEAEFTYVDAESCVLTESILYKGSFCLLNLQNSNLSDCHASESRWNCSIFDKSDVSRIDLTKSYVEFSAFRDTIMAEAELTHTVFKDVLFDNLNGRGILSSYSRFDRCSFVNAYLPSSNFNYTIFFRCDMEFASMMGSTIEEADFIECDFENSNFNECVFIKVNFENNLNFKKDIFHKCVFIECKYSGDDEDWSDHLKGKGVFTVE